MLLFNILEKSPLHVNINTEIDPCGILYFISIVSQLQQRANVNDRTMVRFWVRVREFPLSCHGGLKLLWKCEPYYGFPPWVVDILSQRWDGQWITSNTSSNCIFQSYHKAAEIIFQVPISLGTLCLSHHGASCCHWCFTHVLYQVEVISFCPLFASINVIMLFILSDS